MRIVQFGSMPPCPGRTIMRSHSHGVWRRPGILPASRLIGACQVVRFCGRDAGQSHRRPSSWSEGLQSTTGMDGRREQSSKSIYDPPPTLFGEALQPL